MKLAALLTLVACGGDNPGKPAGTSATDSGASSVSTTESGTRTDSGTATDSSLPTETGGLRLTQVQDEVGSSTISTDCGLAIQSGVAQVYGEDPLAVGQVSCTGLADVWSVAVTAGDALHLTVDAAGRDEPWLYVMRPDGCLVASVAESGGCPDGEGGCASVAIAADQTGAWTVAVMSWSCSGDTLAYTVTGEVQ